MLLLLPLLLLLSMTRSLNIRQSCVNLLNNWSSTVDKDSLVINLLHSGHFCFYCQISIIWYNIQKWSFEENNNLWHIKHNRALLGSIEIESSRIYYLDKWTNVHRHKYIFCYQWHLSTKSKLFYPSLFFCLSDYKIF